jgi:hypothetical protein
VASILPNFGEAGSGTACTPTGEAANLGLALNTFIV